MTGDAASDSDDIPDRDGLGASCERLVVAEQKEAPDMNDVLNPNKMLEVTRLTRAGRLTEATALLQRILRGETAPDIKFGTAGDIAPSGREPSTIDGEAITIEEVDRPPSPRFGIDTRPADMTFPSTATTAQPHKLRGLSALLDRVKRWLWAPITRLDAAPPGVPTGDRAGGRKVH